MTILTSILYSAIWTKPELCVKDSTGHSNTDATDTKLPPKSLLPAPATVETSSVNLAAIIMGIYNSGASGTGIEASDVGKQSVGSDDVEPAPPEKAPRCSVSSSGEPSCKKYKNRFCDTDYSYCDPETGEKIPYHGCVQICGNIGARCRLDPNDEYRLGRCKKTGPDRELTERQLDNSWGGYCATLYKKGGLKCGQTTNSEKTVTPDSTRPRVRRDGDELFEA